jgi:hypothetical protein
MRGAAGVRGRQARSALDGSLLHHRSGFPRAAAKAAALLCMYLLAACAVRPQRPALVATLEVGRFSTAVPGGEFPAGWRQLILSRFKKPTQYHPVSLDGITVAAAHASASASGLVHDVDMDLHQYPWLRWRWKVQGLIPGADLTQPRGEDSPARIMLAFTGDVATLGFADRMFFREFAALTGKQLPYATLMYVWENRLAPGTVVANPHTSRIQMIVTQSGSANVGRWVEERRNVLEDYRATFGSEPGRVISVAIMTDGDNTGASVDAYYGDIAFEASAP